MKSVLKILSFIFAFSMTCWASEPLGITGLSIHNTNQGEPNGISISILNKNAQRNVSLPAFNTTIEIGIPDVPYYSYYYDGQKSIIDIQCVANGNHSSQDVYINFDKDKGIQSVEGKCQVMINGTHYYITPKWDGNPHGEISFGNVD